MQGNIFLGVLSAAIIICSFLFYFFGIIRGKTQPHPFSWLIWGMLTGIACVAQLFEGAGAGAWVTGFSSISSLCIGFAGLRQGAITLSRFDWMSFMGGILALIAWRVTKNALAAVLLVTLADACGFMPTLRKGFHNPFNDTATTFALDAAAFLIGIMILETYSVTTVLYPAAIALFDASFVVVLLLRRAQKQKMLGA